MPSSRRLPGSAHLASLTLFAFMVSPALADNWPQWRGAKLDGISTETGLPTTFSKTENVLWRLPLPGAGGSTPVIWDNQIFLTSADGNDLVLLAVSTDGKQQWKKTLSSGNRRVRDDEGNYASPSPSTDGKHVWAYVGTGHLACFTVDGKDVWKADLQERYGKFDIQFGMTSTPVLDNGRLYLQLIHSAGAWAIALDAATGEEIWKQKRPSDARDECEHSYASPVIYRDGDLELLITHGADFVVAHRLSDGVEVWRCGGMNPKNNYNPTLRFVASPVAVDGLIVVPSAKNGPILGLDPAGKGILTDKEGQLWKRANNTPDVPSPLVHDGLVYLCREDGTLLVLDAKSGELVYQKRAHGDRHRASPVYADGHIYLTARDGTVTVVKAGRQFEIVSQNKMEESISSSPAISNGRLYLRTFDALYAVGEK
jgi:outer membrane protein assembly factor BamB